MDISVIVPIYNVEKYIEKSLRSLFSQTKTDGVEFILVNDCTPDNSMTVVQRVINDFPIIDVKVINNKENQGSAATRQNGQNVAQGEYLAFIDSDDYCDPTMLEDMYAEAVKTNADIVVADFYFTYPDREEVHSQNLSGTPVDVLRAIYRSQVYPSIWTKMIKRSLYVDNNIHWVKGINMGEDVVICSKLLSNAKSFAYLRKPFVHYVQNAASMVYNYSYKTCMDLVNGAKEIERYLREKNVIELYHDDFMFYKVNVKLLGMRFSKDKTQQREFARLFPETNPYICKHPDYRWYHKIALTFAAWHIMLPMRIMYHYLPQRN